MTVRVRPQQSDTVIREIRDEYIKIDLKEKAIQDRANQELLRLLARVFEVKPEDIKILKGRKSRTKTIIIKGIDERSARQILERNASKRR